MRAIGLYEPLAIDNKKSLQDLEIPQPQPQGHDLLVAVKAISVNPVDTKVRMRKDSPVTTAQILGWDVAGEVVSIGDQVHDYAVGEQVFYAGDITRPGANSEFHLVDERIVGKKPQTLSYADAAALPLTGITAWEALFERLEISSKGGDSGKTILIIGGAGGVGSIAIQLASKLAKLNVIATASQEKSRQWCHKLGADTVINHRESLQAQLLEQKSPQVDYILCLNNTTQHWPAMAEIIAAQGKICSIVDTDGVDINLLKSKSATFVWEFMFTRSMYQTSDMIEQQRLLNSISDLIDHGELQITTGQIMQPINAENLRQAHALLEQGHMVGKIVLEGWE